MVLLVLSIFMVDDSGLARHDWLIIAEAAVQGLRSRDERSLALSSNRNLREGKWLEWEVASKRLEVLDLANLAGESLCNCEENNEKGVMTSGGFWILQFWSMMPRFYKQCSLQG